ncbi:MAG: hypothetical protein ABSC23_03255 [Bryobacteraceae bacterium]|jgi:hypothetical protein
MFLRYCFLGCALVFPSSIWAQGESSGFTFDASVQGSANSLATVTKLDASVGYSFNRHWQVDLGVPYYFVSPSSSTTAATGAEAVRGIGNAYAQIRFMLPNPLVNYVSTVTGSGPTGDRNKGLSTGHATVDWSNYFDRGFGPFTPFVEAGIANTVSDTPFFIRPFLTSGFVAHGQGGVRYRFAPWMQAGVTGYLIEPHGQQTIVSRVVTKKIQTSNSTLPVNLPQNTPAATLVNGLLNNPNKPVFETTTVTTGSASLARDSGVSTWLLFGKSSGLNLQVGYTRSREYGLNTVFFGAGYNLRRAL